MITSHIGDYLTLCPVEIRTSDEPRQYAVLAPAESVAWLIAHEHNVMIQFMATVRVAYERWN